MQITLSMLPLSKYCLLSGDDYARLRQFMTAGPMLACINRTYFREIVLLIIFIAAYY